MDDIKEPPIAEVTKEVDENVPPHPDAGLSEEERAKKVRY
jgi:hypothetical protein